MPNAVPLRICLKRVTCSKSHADRSWLKAVAPRNMSAIVCTVLVLHVLSGWLKAVAPANISLVVVTPFRSSAATP